MKKKNDKAYVYKLVAVFTVVLVASAVLFACAGKREEPPEEPEEEKTEYTANSPLGIAESFVGKDVKGLIEAVGTLKGDPVIEPSNDGGGYQGTYEFDGFTVYTYAKAEDAEAIVTEIVPDTESEVYKKSIKTDSGESGK
ncbi:MAG: hypothetical protein IKF54_01905 [Eubacterium sp.]|nr:hypothetical protein [Eubacterium sp.]